VVNIKRSYNDLHRLVKRDSMMKDSLLTELAILISMPALYTSRSFDKEAVMDILTDISSKGQNENIKKIAANMKTMLLKNSEGQKAADFNLYGLDGNKYSLSDFNDKYTYILVWTSTCKECYTELRMLKELNADMDDIINFVAISLDAKPQLARTVKETYEIEYDILFYNIDFINNYNIEIIPSAFLIDNEGNFVSKTAPLPTQKFKEYFIKMLNKKKANLD
jgi:peroxiredoxin